MQDYYKELTAGHPKDASLQFAKKSFLKNADRLHAHPIYWAPFVQFGRADPIEFADNAFSNWWIFLGALTIWSILIYFLKNRMGS